MELTEKKKKNLIRYCFVTDVIKHREFGLGASVQPYNGLAMSGGAPAACQARGDVGDASVRAHGVPLPRRARAASVTLREEHSVAAGDVLSSGGAKEEENVSPRLNISP